VVENPQKLVRGLVLHRKQREAQVLDALRRGERRISAMVAEMYKNIDSGLHPAAGQSVLAHLLDLEARGLVGRHGEEWRIAA
jgi:hypothetical protein